MAEGDMLATAKHIADTIYFIGFSYISNSFDSLSGEDSSAAATQVLRVIEITVLTFGGMTCVQLVGGQSNLSSRDAAKKITSLAPGSEFKLPNFQKSALHQVRYMANTPSSDRG